MKHTTVLEEKSIVSDISALDLKISRIALAKVTSNWQSDILPWPFTRCYCIQSGHAILHTPDGETKMQAGNIYFLPSGYPCGYSGDGDMFKMWIHFTFSLYETQDVFERIGRIIVLENKAELIDKMIEAYNYDTFKRSVALSSFVHAIVSEAVITAGIGKSELLAYSDFTKAAIVKIEKNCRINLRAEELAELMGTSVLNLQRQFKKDTGIPLGQYIKKRVLHRTAIELKKSGSSIKEISDNFGFTDQFYFANTFKKYYGVQPSVYRKSNII